MDGTVTGIAVAAMAAGPVAAVAPEVTGVMGADVMDGAAMVSVRMDPAETGRAQMLPELTVRAQALAVRHGLTRV